MSGNMPDPTTAPPWLGTGTVADVHEVAKWLALTSVANREWWFNRSQENSDQAHRCWEHDHEARLEKLQQRLNAANERIDWLERHYVEGGRNEGPHPQHRPERRPRQGLQGMPAVSETHVGRRFSGPDWLSYQCECPKQPCGLTVMQDWLPDCPFHQMTKTIRQSHSLNACPGREEKP